MHPRVVRHLIHPYFMWRMGRRVGEARGMLEASQWWSAAQLRALQWEKLQRLLTHAYAAVPYYRELFQQVGMTPEDVQSLEDLRRLPPLTKEVIRERTGDLVAQTPLRLSRRRTSGSTGIPMRTYVDAQCWDWWLGAEERSRAWWGVEVGDRGAKLTTVIPSPLRRLKLYYLLNEAVLSTVDLSAAAMDRLYRQLVRFRPAFLFGTSTTTLAHFAQHVLDQQHPTVRLRAVFCTGEVLYPRQRATIQRAFACPVVNEYGSSESWVIAAECPHGGMHVMAENVYVEGWPRAGEEDITEILLTDLNNYGMPFIRYAIGDLGAPLDGRCPCGRGLPLMVLRGGRTNDLAVLPGGRFIDNAVFCEIFERGGMESVRQYRISQEALDYFTVQIVAEPDVAIEEAVRNGFRHIVGAAVAVQVRFVHDIPREPGGKLRHFVSLLPAAPERPREPLARIH